MTTIHQLIQARECGTWSVSSSDSVYDAVEKLVDKDVGALMVIDGDQLVGVISERDCARKVLLSGKSPKDVAVREVMSSKVITADPDYTVDQCMKLMSERRIRHLPIMEDNKVKCVISQGDLVKSVISEQKQIIDQLEHYIAG